MHYNDISEPLPAAKKARTHSMSQFELQYPICSYAICPREGLYLKTSQYNSENALIAPLFAIQISPNHVTNKTAS